MAIQATDRIAAVIARDERLVEILAAASPAFSRLRSPVMRRTMARLVTVEQAARMAGLDAEELVALLNQALEEGEAGVDVEGSQKEERRMPETRDEATAGAASSMPAVLKGIAPDRIVDADVREDLRRGEEPFRKIMDARKRLPEGGVLRVRAIFEPVPLYAVMAKQGLTHWTERLADDDWRVWFYAGDGAGTEAQVAAPPTDPGDRGGSDAHDPRQAGAEEGAGDDDVVVLDVRGLEPPEPMVQTLEALERLPAGKTLVQINVRVPQFLLPQLEARGFSYEIREQEPGLVRVFIRRAAEGA
ncbi:MAG TPA: DUF2249 domain-containing protein [Longimicrobiales bacterium]